ncbi:MAG TPA: T9SS type A sorting domain-containing protein [Saprospiraceae bacterium]|nr:T9SS type A sorting domain-containing protein [Saprospiraceae bacterium]
MRAIHFTLIVFFLINFSNLFGQSYFKLLKDGRNWIYTEMVSGEEPPVHITLAFALSMNGDTLVQGNSYKKIYQRTLKTNAGSTAIQNPKEILNSYLYALMREDTNARKVYMLPYSDIISMCQPTEHLLYDFSLQEGDTLNDCVLENIYLHFMPNKPHVDSIRHLTYSGLETRAFYMQGVFDNYGDFFETTGLILEGYGYEQHGLINYGRNGQLVWFQYFCEGDSLDCELLSAVQEPPEIPQPVISISPNPTSDILIIQIDPAFRKENELQVSILNAAGDIVLGVNWNTWKELEVDVSNFHDGMYFLNVNGEEMRAVKKNYNRPLKSS